MSHVPGSDIAGHGSGRAQHDEGCHQLLLTIAQQHRHRDEKRRKADELQEACAQRRAKGAAHFLEIQLRTHGHKSQRRRGGCHIGNGLRTEDGHRQLQHRPKDTDEDTPDDGICDHSLEGLLQLRPVQRTPVRLH